MLLRPIALLCNPVCSCIKYLIKLLPVGCSGSFGWRVLANADCAIMNDDVLVFFLYSFLWRLLWEKKRESPGRLLRNLQGISAGQRYSITKRNEKENQTIINNNIKTTAATKRMRPTRCRWWKQGKQNQRRSACVLRPPRNRESSAWSCHYQGWSFIAAIGNKSWKQRSRHFQLRALVQYGWWLSIIQSLVLSKTRALFCLCSCLCRVVCV